MSKDTPLQAFPGLSHAGHDSPGMTLRDSIAIAALQGLLENASKTRSFTKYSELAYGLADAMMVERSV